jgi:hypothetical protein
MECSLYRIATPVLLILGLAAPAAWAQKVDLEKETHFRCYIVSRQSPQTAMTVTLEDQFLRQTLTVDEPLEFCAPTSKDGLPILEPEEHLTMYGAAANLVPHLLVDTTDQFGPRTLEAVAARVLLVPTQKLVGELGFPTKLNHYWCYDVNGEPADRDVTLADQFGTDMVRVEQPTLFCNPVEKTQGGATFRIDERAVHLTCYDLHGPQRTQATQFGVFNQLENDTFTVSSWEQLCVPSIKNGFRSEQ